MFIVNKKSWHYRLATIYNPNIMWEMPSNFCEYSMRVGVGFLFLLICFVGFFFELGLPIGDLAVTFLIAMGSIGITALLAFWLMNLHKYIHRHDEFKKKSISRPSFLGVLYDKLRNKVCVGVKYED
jgi:hypothetical protein